jgi:N-hydroxyarylamine O-acetyltransferase
MISSRDLTAYRQRIGWHDTAAHDLVTLSAVLRAHMQAIPFENLDVLLGRPVSLEVPALMDKLVHARRGGYCFEHATLFAAVLEALGFAPARHIARVIVVAPRNLAARTHMFLSVPLHEGLFLVDPGFGALAPHAPVALVDGRPTSVDGETHWMHREDRHWVLCTRVDGRTQECWITALEHDNPVDFEMGNHYTATHPASAFRSRLMLRALTPRGRVTVMNRDATLRDGEHVERRELADRRDLRALVAAHFGFDMPEIEALRVPSVPDWA